MNEELIRKLKQDGQAIQCAAQAQLKSSPQNWNLQPPKVRTLKFLDWGIAAVVTLAFVFSLKIKENQAPGTVFSQELALQIHQLEDHWQSSLKKEQDAIMEDLITLKKDVFSIQSSLMLPFSSETISHIE